MWELIIQIFKHTPKTAKCTLKFTLRTYLRFYVLFKPFSQSSHCFVKWLSPVELENEGSLWSFIYCPQKEIWSHEPDLCEHCRRWAGKNWSHCVYSSWAPHAPNVNNEIKIIKFFHYITRSDSGRLLPFLKQGRRNFSIRIGQRKPADWQLKDRCNQ